MVAYMTTRMTHHQQQLTTPSFHEHTWRVESTHATSTGRVLYVRCDQCGAWRVDLQDHRHVPRAALSKELRGG
jgi:hypothetical protein